jgi:RNA ligase
MLYSDVPKLEDFEKAHADGRVSRHASDDYILFKYKTEVQFERSWDNITLHARGIIFDALTKELVVFPFKKFFNLGETDSHLSAVPNMNFELLEKCDGSMGCVFLNRDGELQVATPGSLQSDQAIWATKWIRAQNEDSAIREMFTHGGTKCLICEIIYDGSKVVVDYDFEGLVLTAAQVVESDGSVRYATHSQLVDLAESVDLRVCKLYDDHSLESALELLSTVENFEGFVLHWPDTGFRIKIKGDEYCRLHRIVSAIHPNRINEAIQCVDGYASIEHVWWMIHDTISKFPEEHVGPYSAAFNLLRETVTKDFAKVKSAAEGFDTPKELALHLKSAGDDFEKKNFGFILNTYNGKMQAKRFIMNRWEGIRAKFFGNSDK